MRIPEKFVFTEGRADVEISSNYGDWKESVKRYIKDETSPIIQLKTTYIDDGEEHVSYQGLSVQQAGFIVDWLTDVIECLVNESINEENRG